MSITKTICEKFYLDKKTLMSFAQTAPYRYKIYNIPKRNGSGVRTIAHPSKELKFFQRAIAMELELQLPVSSSATAYRKGASIKNNALRHIHSRYLLKMDLTNFFPSISPNILFSEMELQGIHVADEDRSLITLMLFRKTAHHLNFFLSIGAPSSPLISNFIMYRFDETVREHCTPLGIQYTRYADDMTFSTSTPFILQDIPATVSKTLHSLFGDQIKVNTAKTVFSSKKHNRHITGITLTNDEKLSLGRDRKRLISAMIHRYIKTGINNEEVRTLQGLYSFAKFIEPEFHLRMIKKYGFSAINQLIHHSA